MRDIPCIKENGVYQLTEVPLLALPDKHFDSTYVRTGLNLIVKFTDRGASKKPPAQLRPLERSLKGNHVWTIQMAWYGHDGFDLSVSFAGGTQDEHIKVLRTAISSYLSIRKTEVRILFVQA